VPVNDLAAGVSTKKLYRNAHLTLERPPRLSVADMNATMTPRRGLRVAEPAAAVGVSADTIRHYEWTGLLLAPARTWPRRRPGVARLRFIRGRNTGASRHQRPAGDPRYRRMLRRAGRGALRRRLADLDAEIGSAERAARADRGHGRGAAISALRTAGARQLVPTREPQAVIPVIEAPYRANCDPRMYRPQLPCGC
jgi:hypothetical protein